MNDPYTTPDFARAALVTIAPLLPSPDLTLDHELLLAGGVQAIGRARRRSTSPAGAPSTALRWRITCGTRA